MEDNGDPRLDEIRSQIEDQRRSWSEVVARLETTIINNESALENSHRQITNYLRWTGILVSLIALFTAGGLTLSVINLYTVRNQVVSQVSSQVPPEVNNAVSSAVPSAALFAAQTRVAEELSGLQATIDSEVATMVVQAIETQVPRAAVTAVAQAEEGDYTIVVASDTSIEGALLEASRLRALGYDPDIYKIGEYFATTIGKFRSVDALETALIQARSEIIASAYFIDLSNSCPNTKFFNPGYFGCSLEPWE